MNLATKPRAFFLLFLVLAAACTKIDTTTLGGDLVPVVDNINTFDTILEVNSTNYIPNDSSRFFISDPHIAGAIDNDPLFGASKSTLFFEMKPVSFPFTFAPADSIVGFDSAVLVLSYKGYYGDSSSPVTLGLYESDRTMYRDTTVLPYYTFNPPMAPNLSKFLGQKTLQPRQFKDTTYIKRGDSVYSKVINQLRIPINQTYARALFYQDSSGAYANDSTFKEFVKGFALKVNGSANAMLYFGLTDPSSRIEFYYRTKITGRTDTTAAYFPVTSLCAHAVKFERNRAGAEVNNFLTADPVKGASQIYIQNAPGTMASIKIPDIKNLTNRVIHRAELRVTELTPNTTYPQLLPPTALFLDMADTGNVYKGIPYDMAPLTNYYCFPNLAIEYFYFGGPTKMEAVSGEQLAVYRFNITRHLQGIITRKEPSFNFRLSAPYYVEYANCINNTLSAPANFFFLRTTSNTIANLPGNGRVKVAGGSHPDPNKRMQLRIIYSKL